MSKQKGPANSRPLEHRDNGYTDSTATCRRCGRQLFAVRSIRREAGCICWRRLRAEAVTA
jgi:hypothetical protein